MREDLPKDKGEHLPKPGHDDTGHLISLNVDFLADARMSPTAVQPNERDAAGSPDEPRGRLDKIDQNLKRERNISELPVMAVTPAQHRASSQTVELS